MAERFKLGSTILSFVTLHFFISSTFAAYSLDYLTPANCRKGPNDNFHEFFDISQLKCKACAQSTAYQTVSSDGLRCVCKDGMRLTRDYGGADIQCTSCPAGQFTSASGWECAYCATASNGRQDICPPCSARTITVERLIDGTWNRKNFQNTRVCKACAGNTEPDATGQRCQRCNQLLSVLPGQSNCQCPDSQRAGGVCFANAGDLIADNSALYKVKYDDGTELDSAFFSDNVRAAQAMCSDKYKNLTACQTLGNLCNLIMYTRKNEGRSASNDACSLYLELLPSTGRQKEEWPANMPWLYYLQENADRVLTDEGITTKYTFPNSKLSFKVAKYAANGTFLGLLDASNGQIQLCKASSSVLDAAYSFGTAYQQTCQIPVKYLWDKYETYFYDMYLQYTDGVNKQLFPVPVLIENYVDPNDKTVNEDISRTSWQLVRRFFLMDNLSGKPVSSGTSTSTRAQVVRYPQSMTIHVELQKSQDGKIYPPYLRIRYAEVKEADYNTDKSVQVSFSVTYNMNLEGHYRGMSIAVGVLSALAIVYAGVLTWGWSKRGGKIAIDFVTLIKFLFFCAGTLANTFFVVCLGSALWWWIFYKRQNDVYLLVPTRDQEGQFIAFLSVAFALKLIQLVHLIVCQVTVDIFFIDWERPQGKNGPSGDAQQKKGPQESPVSIWRTYFVANEWNEIQTTRKINQIFQIFVVVFFLTVVGFQNLASTDPRNDLIKQVDVYYGPDSRIFRFAIGALVYLLVGLAQWIFYTFIYERFIEDKVRQYVDLCSMANVSVFILENSHFGYYIHGRSVFGRADTDLREMHENLKKEELDLCGQRGLLPNTEQQTFMMAVPRRLRAQYDKVLLPLSAPQTGGQAASRAERGQGGNSHLDAATDKSIESYFVINRFLQAFIDHSLRDTDYLIKDKMLMESILNVEFFDGSDKGFFYNDSGHSFDNVLFFGNETTLMIFEILFFCIVDLIAQNFLLAGVLTYILMEIIVMIRDSLGRKNLAKKTLVDERFLI